MVAPGSLKSSVPLVGSPPNLAMLSRTPKYRQYQFQPSAVPDVEGKLTLESCPLIPESRIGVLRFDQSLTGREAEDCTAAYQHSSTQTPQSLNS